MNKIIKLALVLLSTIGLILATASTSFSKVEGDKIILGAAVSLTGNIHQMVFILKTVIIWPLKELTAWVVLK